MKRTKALLIKITKSGLQLFNGFPIKYWYQGDGQILMLHRVRPRSKVRRLRIIEDLEITPEYLEELIKYYIKSGYTFLSLDELYESILTKKQARKFVVFTLDDGYYDNYQFAYPIFLKYNIPFAIYITNNFPDKTSIMWWYYLENLILNNSCIEVEGLSNKQWYKLNCFTDREKQSVYGDVRRLILNKLTSNKITIVRGLFDSKNAIIDQELLRTMSWDEIKELSDDSLVTLGCHTLNHLNLSILPKKQMVYEIIESKKQLTEKLNKPIEHFAFPFGTKDEVFTRELEFVRETMFKTVTTSFDTILRMANVDAKCLPRLYIAGNNDFHNQVFGINQFISCFNTTKS